MRTLSARGAASLADGLVPAGPLAPARSFAVKEAGNLGVTDLAAAPDGSRLSFANAKAPVHMPDGSPLEADSLVDSRTVTAVNGFTYVSSVASNAGVHRHGADGRLGYDPGTNGLDVPASLAASADGSALVAWGQTQVVVVGNDSNAWGDPRAEGGRDVPARRQLRVHRGVRLPASGLHEPVPRRGALARRPGPALRDQIGGHVPELATDEVKTLGSVPNAEGLRIVWPAGGKALVSLPLDTSTDPARHLYEGPRAGVRSGRFRFDLTSRPAPPIESKVPCAS